MENVDLLNGSDFFSPQPLKPEILHFLILLFVEVSFPNSHNPLKSVRLHSWHNNYLRVIWLSSGLTCLRAGWLACHLQASGLFCWLTYLHTSLMAICLAGYMTGMRDSWLTSLLTHWLEVLARWLSYLLIGLRASWQLTGLRADWITNLFTHRLKG